MNPLKQLAGQTVLYGVSTILGRLLNYALVPLHTFVFEDPAQYGAITKLYAYVAILNVIYTYGLETAYFRFVSRRKDDEAGMKQVYDSAVTSVLLSSFVFSSLIILSSGGIANFIGYPDAGHIVVWLGLIMFTDAVMAIPYARLRQENRPLKFAITKISSIVITVLLNVFFLMGLPVLQDYSPVFEAIYSPKLGVSYVFLANLIGNATIPLFLWKSLAELKLRIHWPTLRHMLQYSYPILIMGLAGMLNDQFDKLVLEDLLPVNFYPDQTPAEALGTYGACFKISVLMLLAIQAFRYAGEPFFFSRAEDKEAPELFARVMHYFSILSIFILLGVSLNVELIGDIFLQNPGYKDALFVVPFLLLAKLLFGIYTNLSVWFKLTDRTHYGTYFSLLGAAVTVTGNILLIPVLGYLGCALASIACFLLMCVACYFYGQKYYPIPYNFKPTLLYTLAAAVLIYFSFQWEITQTLLRHALNFGLVALFVLLVFLIERKKLSYSKV
jgi:O-antigen/teichoic acid export membrane protein